MKKFNVMHNIGKVKYLVNFHDGVKTHNDGSRFFDIATFKNKKKMGAFTDELKNSGYIESNY